MFEFVLFISLWSHGSDGRPQYYPAQRPLFPAQQPGWYPPQPQHWPEYYGQANNHYPQLYQQQQPQQYPYYPSKNFNLDYPVVGYDLALNGLPSFPDVVYMDTSGQYDQSVFQLTQGDKKIYWRRPEERDDVLWIDDDSKHENNNLGPSDPYSRETWPSENINDDPPDKGWGGSFDSVSHIPEIPKNTIDMRSEDPDDALWIDDDPHDETISETFSSEPSTSFTFTASSPLESMEDEVESEEGSGTSEETGSGDEEEESSNSWWGK